MAEYPAHLAREHRLFGGRTVTLRPIRPGDAALEREFLIDLSGESRYLRFQKWVRAPSEKLIHFLTDVDYEHHMAIVCTHRRDDHEELVGEARYVINPDGRSCEFGIVIADAWHGTGIAGLLMEALMSAARERGLASMEGLVLASNREMLRFVRALGFEVYAAAEDRRTVRIVKTLRAAAPGTRQ
jgi:acetyltransferase